ncbi:hypothetical protein J4206_02615 [Candidatus Woesearchaeota archaeon]|nr:hypothetical protein [Candidatus Woesearchaeota archaeon]
MQGYEEKLKNYLQENNIHAEHLVFSESCHSVKDAAKAVDASPEDFVKNICFVDLTNSLIVAIVKGEDKVDANKIASVLKIPKPKIATPEEILEKTGYPCGGTPSFGYDAVFLVDTRVMEKERVYTGGGSITSLIKISVNEMLRANKGMVGDIRK